jgi:hypothetical protein
MVEGSGTAIRLNEPEGDKSSTAVAGPVKPPEATMPL